MYVTDHPQTSLTIPKHHWPSLNITDRPWMSLTAFVDCLLLLIIIVQFKFDNISSLLGTSLHFTSLHFTSLHFQKPKKCLSLTIPKRHWPSQTSLTIPKCHRLPSLDITDCLSWTINVWTGLLKTQCRMICFANASMSLAIESGFCSHELDVDLLR